MKSLHDLIWIIPSSLLVGLALSLLGPGIWWIGWLSYFIFLALGLLALSALWRSAGSVRSLGWMLLLALVLRLGLGIFFSVVLPVYGNNNDANHGGYIYKDELTYDTQAWSLAASGDPLWKAFDKTSGINDQYGGLTLTLSLVYRFFSPDAHRPWLTILLSALAGSLGVVLAWKGARQVWGEKTALILGWIMALYPESLLVGSSQIREPYLLLFIAMLFWAAVTLLDSRRPSAWIWLAAGTLGLLLFSPAVAVVALLVLGIWFWLAHREMNLRWWWVAVFLVVIGLAGMLFSQSIVGLLKVHGGPLTNLINWLTISLNAGAYEATLNSGWVQTIFKALPRPLFNPFVVTYGIAQPVLPAAIADPAVWPVRFIGILRGLGWYALIPLLIYGLRPIWKTVDRRARMAWLWLWLSDWVWIIVSSLRAAGDQWDNPRYRVILLLIQAALAACSLIWARQNHDRWLWRILAIEGVFLLIFGYWYFSRYAQGVAGPMNIFLVFGLIATLSVTILVGGLIWDRYKPLR